MVSNIINNFADVNKNIHQNSRRLDKQWQNKMKEFKVYYSITGEFNENESFETKSEADKFYNEKVSEGIWDRVEKNY